MEYLLNVLRPELLLAILGGAVIGTVVGIIPGLGSSMAIAMLIPITYGMSPEMGLLALVSIYCFAVWGGSITAILIGTPGTPSSAATWIDGYPLAKQGKGTFAIITSTVASTIGGVIGALALMLIAPPLARVALLFGPFEYFLVAALGLTIIATLASDSFIKGFITTFLGLFFSCIGLFVITGQSRYTLGIPVLLTGIPLIPSLIGLFSFSQALCLLGEGESTVKAEKSEDTLFLPSVIKCFAYMKSMILCGFVGTIIGILPGVGANIASWVGYGYSKQFSKRSSNYGKGEPEGVAASESANNAVCASSLIPMVTLGIPGSGTAAILMGGLIIHGLTPGPELFMRHADLMYTVMWGILLTQLLIPVIGYLGIRHYSKIVRVPNSVLIPLIIVFCITGTFAIRNSYADILIMLFFGILGYIMRHAKYNASPIAIALILGNLAERSLLLAIQLSAGSFSYYFSKPLSVVLMVLIVLSLGGQIYLARLKKGINLDKSL